MAAMVCLRRDKQELGTDEYQVLEVVDGQQRLTTLIILLKAICIALDRSVKDEEKLYLELSDLLVKPEGGELLLLQTNHDSSHYFANYLRHGARVASKIAATIADREILEAIESCHGFVESWSTGDRTLLSLASLLKNKLYFLLHEIDQERTVYTVFEVLNSRGLTVSWLDRLKSILMGMAFDMPKANAPGVIRELHSIWRDIYSSIGLRQGLSTEALRFAATLQSKSAPSRPLSEEDAVEALRATGAVSAAALRQVAAWLLDCTNACDSVLANTRLNAVTRISQARLLAVAIALRTDFTESERDGLLKRWERVTFRIYGMLGNDARTRVGDYVRLAWRVINEQPKFKEIDQAICDIGSEFPIDEAIKALRGADCYDGWERELRYMMFRYEEYLAKLKGMRFKNEQWAKIWLASPSDSIEHIFPKSRGPVKAKNRLGNLVLLPPNLNSQLQDKMPKDKADAYRDTGLLIAVDVAKAIEREGWLAKSIVEREDSILEWAKTEWGD